MSLGSLGSNLLASLGFLPHSVAMHDQKLMEKIVSLAKRRGFIFPGSEIYGGLAGTYDYGPLGVVLKENVEHLWL